MSREDLHCARGKRRSEILEGNWGSERVDLPSLLSSSQAPSAAVSRGREGSKEETCRSSFVASCADHDCGKVCRSARSSWKRYGAKSAETI